MEITKEKTIIGFIGLGVMGHSMAGHILEAGFALHLYNRTLSKADDLVEKGAVLEASVADLAKKSDVIISIVGFPADVEEVYLGISGVLANAKPGSIAFDMTTSEPDLAMALYEKGKEKGKSTEAKGKGKSEESQGKGKSTEAKAKEKKGSEEMKKAVGEKKEAQKTAKESGEKMGKEKKSRWKFWKKK